MSAYLRSTAIHAEGLSEPDIVIGLPARVLRTGLVADRKEAILHQEMISVLAAERAAGKSTRTLRTMAEDRLDVVIPVVALSSF